MSLGAAMAPAGEPVRSGRNKKFLTRSQSVLPNLLLPTSYTTSTSTPQHPLERPPKSPGYEIAPSRKKLCRSETLATDTPSESSSSPSSCSSGSGHQRQGSPAGKPPRPNRREFRRQRTVGDMFQLVLGRGKSHLSSLFRRESSAKKSGACGDSRSSSPTRSRLNSSGHSDNSSDSVGGGCSGGGGGGGGGGSEVTTSSFSSCPDLLNSTVVAMDTSGPQPERKKKSAKQRKVRKGSSDAGGAGRHSASQQGQLEHGGGGFRDCVMHGSPIPSCREGKQQRQRQQQEEEEDHGMNSDDMEVHDLEMSDLDALCDGAGSSSNNSNVICVSSSAATVFTSQGHGQDASTRSHRRLTRAKTTGAWDEVPTISFPVPTLDSAADDLDGQQTNPAGATTPPRFLDSAQQHGRRSPGAGSLSGTKGEAGSPSSPKSAADKPRATSAGMDKRVEMCGRELADLERWQSMRGLSADWTVGSGRPAASTSVPSIAKFLSESLLSGDSAGEGSVIKTALHKSRSLEPDAGSRRESVASAPATAAATAATGEGLAQGQGQNNICRVLDFLYLGTLDASTNEPLLCKLNIGALLDLSNAHSHRIAPPPRRGNECPCACFGRRHFRSRLNIAVDDIEWENLAAYFDDINSFMEGCRRAGRSVLVFSYHGKSRGPAAVAQYLMRHHGFGLAQALAHLRACRSDVAINQGFLKSLRKLDEQLAAERGDSRKEKRSQTTSSHVSPGHLMSTSFSSSPSSPSTFPPSSFPSSFPSSPTMVVPGMTVAGGNVVANGNASLSPSRVLPTPEQGLAPDSRRPTVRDAWADL